MLHVTIAQQTHNSISVPVMRGTFSTLRATSNTSRDANDLPLETSFTLCND